MMVPAGRMTIMMMSGSCMKGGDLHCTRNIFDIFTDKDEDM